MSSLEINSKLVTKNIIAVSLTENLTNLTTNNYVPFNKANVLGRKLELSSGKVVIGAGVRKIKASAVGFIDTPNTSGYLWLQIHKNDSSVGSMLQAGGQTYKSAGIPPIVVDVKEGDIISVFIDNTGGTPYQIRGEGNTVLTVEVLE